MKESRPRAPWSGKPRKRIVALAQLFAGSLSVIWTSKSGGGLRD
jgi:hypothetical protein